MRPLTILRAAAVAALLVTAAAPAAAQGDAPVPATLPAADAPAAPAVSPPSDASAPAEVSGLPARPQTMRPYWHVFLAFTLAWVFLFGYVVTIARKFGRLERELEALRG